MFGTRNWVKELAASDVIEVEREKVRSFLEKTGRYVGMEFTTRLRHQIGENWFNNRVCMKIATNWNDMHQSKIFMRFHSWDVTRASDVVCGCCAFPDFPLQLPIGHQTASSTSSITIINLFTPTTPTVDHKKTVSLFSGVYDFIWLLLELICRIADAAWVTTVYDSTENAQRKFFMVP